MEATPYSEYGNCFALVDLNDDGQDELIVAPYQNDNGTLYYGNVFIPGDDWNSSLVGYVSTIDIKTGLCQYESGDIGGTLYIQKFDGKEFQTIDEYNYDYVWIDGDPTDEITVIHKKADGTEEECTEEEMKSAKIEDNIKAYKLTKENIKKYIQ